MQGLEKLFDEWFVKKAPYQFPESARKGIVEAFPWIAIVGGVIMLLFAWWAYQAVAFVDDLARAANAFGAAFGVTSGYSAANSMLLWLSLILLVVQAVLLFIAYPALVARQKKGWNILFYVALANIVQAVVQVVGNGYVPSLVGSLLSSAVGLYVLFQVRSYYTGKIAAPGVSSTTMQVPKETPAKKPEQKA